jgi:hypothetical protein
MRAETLSELPFLSALTRERLKVAAIAAAACGVAALLFFTDPATATVYPFCVFHALTGLYCPGCGSLRCLHQLLHGHFIEALDLNPLTVMLLPFLGYAFVSHARQTLRGKAARHAPLPAIWIWLLLAIVLAFWVLRNIPAYPFSLLAP